MIIFYSILRDIFVSARFDDMYRDAFTLAFMIPDIVFDLLIGGAIQSAITPTLASSIARGESEKGWRAVNIVISVFSVIVICVCVLGVVFSEPMYMIFKSEEKGTEVAHLAAMASKWLFPQIFFMMLAALSIGILNSYKRFGSTAFGPTVYNICVLASILLFADNSEHKLMMTTAGIMVAACIYFLFQLLCGPDILRNFRFTFDPKDKEFHALVRKALPILLSASVVRINMAILNFFAEQIPDHVTFLLRNASTVWQLPYGIFAVAIGSVMLPSIASLYGEKKCSFPYYTFSRIYDPDECRCHQGRIPVDVCVYGCQCSEGRYFPDRIFCSYHHSYCHLHYESGVLRNGEDQDTSYRRLHRTCY